MKEYDGWMLTACVIGGQKKLAVNPHAIGARNCDRLRRKHGRRRKIARREAKQWLYSCGHFVISAFVIDDFQENKLQTVERGAPDILVRLDRALKLARKHIDATGKVALANYRHKFPGEVTR